MWFLYHILILKNIDRGIRKSKRVGNFFNLIFMKFLSSILLAVFICSAGIVNAQTDEETLASKNRIAELLNLDLSSNSGIESLDKFVEAVQDAADESVAISTALDEMNQRITNKTNTPSLSELTELSTRINNLAKAVTEASKLSIDAAKGLKELKSSPMKILSATNTLNNAKNALETIAKESVYQVKTISGMIKAIS